MKHQFIAALLGGLGVIATSNACYASAAYYIDCTASPNNVSGALGNLVAGIGGGRAWTASAAIPNSGSITFTGGVYYAGTSSADGGSQGIPAAGDYVAINGICAGDVFVWSSNTGVTFTNHTGDPANDPTAGASQPFASNAAFVDGINGELEVVSAQGITMAGLLLEGPSLTQTGTFGGSGGGKYLADLVVKNGANVVLNTDYVGPGGLSGIAVIRSSMTEIRNTTIRGNGTAGTLSELASGVWAVDGSTVTLGKFGTTSQPSAVVNNGTNGGTCFGDDILLQQSSSLDAFGSIITQSNANSCAAILAQAGSSARLRGTTVTFVGGAAPALQFDGASSARIEVNSTAVGTPASSVAGGGSSAILFAASSSGVLQGATISSTINTAVATIEATTGSSIVLAGGNTITQSGSGSYAIQVDHSSSLAQQAGTKLGYANAADSISGAALVQEQSSMDLGQGLISSSPSISWTTGANGISVQQNSSFRVSGGVSITGAVAITQGSNGFANTANGGTNAISSGASCPFTNVPSSHWASPAKVTPAVPSATSYSSATSPQCLAF